MKIAALALILSACAAAKVVPTPAEKQPSEESQRLAMAEFVVEICTEKATTEERILVADFILRTCKLPFLGCVRKACARTQGEACPKRRHGADL